MVELGPPPSEATEAKKAEPEVAEEPRPLPEEKPEPPRTEVAKADPPKAEPPKAEAKPEPPAKPEPKPEPPKPDPLYPQMVFAWNQSMPFSNEGHGSTTLSMLCSALGARQVGDAAWKEIKTRFFTQIMETAEPDGTFKYIVGKSKHALSLDNQRHTCYLTAICTLMLQLDNGRLHFIGKQQMER